MASQIRASDPRLEVQHSSIRHAKQLCFSRMNDYMAQGNPKFSANAQAVEQMLQLWAKHSGVDARKGMSLDDRLKDHLDLKATFIGLLDLIEQKIAQALSSPDEHAEAETSPAMASRTDEDVDPEEFLIKQKWRSYKGNTWETVGAAIDMLIELTATIRKSTVQNSSLPTHFHRQDDYFAEYTKILARKWFKDARSSLTDQLGDSVFIRRRHMLYKMKHEEKISYPGTHLTPLPVKSTPASLTTRQTAPGLESPKGTTPRFESLRPAVPIFATPSPSSTNLSQIDRIRLQQRRRKIGALSGITEGSVSVEETGFSYMYPEPPVLVEKQRYGVCPYCSGFLSASKLTKEGWRKHLNEDLRPYVCISEKCRDPAQFFSTSAHWLQHMDKLHGRDWPQRVHMVTWYCDRDHDRLEFKSESELQKHLVDGHESLSSAHVNALVRRNWGVGCRDAHVCPLCESTPSSIVPMMNDEDNTSLLFRHIGNHIKSLALFSLPSLNTDPASDEQESSSGAQLPTNDHSKAGSSENNQIVAQVDDNLEGSLNFNDDPHSFEDGIGFETTINEEHVANVPSDLDTNLEWKFASPEHETLEQDPVLQNLRKHGENQQAKNPEEPHERDDLSLRIRDALIFSVFDDPSGYFLPNGSIDNLITKDSVYKELRAEPSLLAEDKAELESLVEFVLVSARKLFATTLLIGNSGHELQSRMKWFQDKDITDDSLPLQMSWWEKNCWYETANNGSGHIGEISIDLRELWKYDEFVDFFFQQHRFLAPVFSDTGLSYDFELETILPFTERDPDVKADRFGMTTQYRIHERHINQHTMDAGRPYYVDVKQAYGDISEMDPSWENQVKLLSQLNSLNHEHLVRFLAAFRKGQKDGYFMFEWASGENLRNLWRTFHRPKLTSGLVKSAFRQISGLTNAINRVYSDLHAGCWPYGDLEPEHILVFNNDNDDELGTLKLGVADLWLAIRNTKSEHMYRVKGGWWYEPPELSSLGLYFKGPQPRASYIWSMGCILLEFLIWLMYGEDGLDIFNQEKPSSLSSDGKYFYQGKREGQGGMLITRVHPVVVEWMDHMAADPACEVGTTALGNLLDLIRTRLLVVKPEGKPGLDLDTRSLPGPVGPQRCTSGELEERMRKISDENETERYWLAAKPKSPLLGPDMIKCICNSTHDDGNAIHCEHCETWQHIDCFYSGNEQDAMREDFEHFCAECIPRPLDREKAIKRALHFEKDNRLW
ncbi:hypothetical protein CEP53_014279 [Fusarium sp. AF-6]|nr:hypothetical protein CEP53_014279 [Fusarium sp. AF-6]